MRRLLTLTFANNHNSYVRLSVLHDALVLISTLRYPTPRQQDPKPADGVDEGSLTQVVAASIDCQPEQVDKHEPLHQSWGALFLGERNHRPVDRAMVVPLLLLCKSTRSSSVVTLLRQDVTHHLTPIDRPDWSAEALVKHA